MLTKTWREQTWADLDQSWDIIVIGGGITGAGIFNMAAQKGLKVLLLEANDFSFGTSSRSSKLVHGGIRYLKNHQFDVVKESVKERERMLRESDGLVDPLAFIFPSYENKPQEAKLMKIAVIVYDLLVPKWQHGSLDREQVIGFLPAVRGGGIIGGIKYFDALVDDSQLVLRVIMDGIRYGGKALNYACVSELLSANSGQVEGVIVEDKSEQLNPAQIEIQGKIIINATGPWSDELRGKMDGTPKLRLLRGSHLIFSQEKLPIHTAMTMLHPRDNRALFTIPWENRTMIGTTDLDHDRNDGETQVTQEEIDYLLEAAQFAFPNFLVSQDDLISTFSGLRPVINTNAPTPSQESRAHQIWEENGMVNVAGGKLTIFRVMAADVLNFVRDRLPHQPKFSHRAPCFIHPKPHRPEDLTNPDWIMMAGRLGRDVNSFFENASREELTKIEPMPEFWAELRWAAENEAVVHLDDLLLRRVRMGLLMPQGGLDQMDKIRKLVQTPLGWSDETWQTETARYETIWRKNYFLPG